MSDNGRVLRSIYIDPDLDQALTIEAFDKRTSKADLLNWYLRLGMTIQKQEKESPDARK